MRTRRILFYTLYERIWHWIQALVIILLLITGLEIHDPDDIHVFGFQAAVSVHTALGFLLIANAMMGLFYHLTTAKIREYLPEPRDFISQAIAQAKFYLKGIFEGAPHPFERVPGRKLNPLQQITYLTILNLLLPLQTITGLLIWGMQMWPGAGAALGGLALVAPLHVLGGWLFGAFILMHVYLTTTGETPMSNIQAMITGYEELPEQLEDEAAK